MKFCKIMQGKIQGANIAIGNDKNLNSHKKEIFYGLSLTVKKYIGFETFRNDKVLALYVKGNYFNYLLNNGLKLTLQRLFSIRNEWKDGKKHKVLTILGIKIKLRSKDV